MSLPTLYYKGKSGAIYQWRVWAADGQVLTEYGQVDGKLQRTTGKACSAKNVGRKNGTTAEQQAELEAKALHTFKLERRYRLSPEEAESPLQLPMLAVDIAAVKTQDYRGHVQPKLDGVRCLASLVDGKVQLLSRSGKPYHVPHIEKALLGVLHPDMVLDGELYCHGVPLQRITSLVKRTQPETESIEYHVYDIPVYGGVDHHPSWHRMDLLGNGPLNQVGHPIVPVRTILVDALDQALEAERTFVSLGYEGAMLRLLDSPYEWGYRSRSLLKIKSFQDGEFEVVGFRAGSGRYQDCVIWQVRNDLNEEVFDCNHACSLADKRYFLENGQDYIGRLLTIKYFGRTQAGIPTYNTGKCFRDREDLQPDC